MEHLNVPHIKDRIFRRNTNILCNKCNKLLDNAKIQLPGNLYLSCLQIVKQRRRILRDSGRYILSRKDIIYAGLMSKQTKHESSMNHSASP